MSVREFFSLDQVDAYTPKGAGYPTSHPELIMGMELEIENCSRDSYRIPGWTVTTDGSLRGANNPGGNAVTGNAFEFISAPMRQKFLAQEVENFFKETGFNEKNYSDRCSVHVHVNCQEYQFGTVGALAMLYTVVEECLFHFIGNERENNIYCVPWYQCRMNHFTVGEIANGRAGAVKEWQKYTALNLQPLRRYGTVEFRHMEGTSDTKRIIQWLNIIGCLFRYAENNSIDAIHKSVMSLNSNSEYRQFFERIFGEYLPWDHTYQQMLEVGVINAKMGASKPSEKKPTTAELLAMMEDRSLIRTRVTTGINDRGETIYRWADEEDVEAVPRFRAQVDHPAPQREMDARAQAAAQNAQGVAQQQNLNQPTEGDFNALFNTRHTPLFTTNGAVVGAGGGGVAAGFANPAPAPRVPRPRQNPTRR